MLTKDSGSAVPGSGVQLTVDSFCGNRAQVMTKQIDVFLFIGSRWSYELLLSVYAALLVITEEAFGESSVFLGRLNNVLEPLFRTLTRLTHRQVLLPERTYFMWAMLALIILLCVHTMGRFVLARRVVCYAAGLAIVCGFPVIWLRVGTCSICLVRPFGGCKLRSSELSRVWSFT
jgi:hypothetical protein